MQIFKCSPKSVKCLHQSGECVSRAKLGDIIELRKEFWGSDVDKPPTETQRKLQMTKILLKAFDHKSRSFSFFCGDLRVCQTGFLILIGLNTRESRPPRHWLRTMKEMQSDGFDPSSFLFDKTAKEESKASLKKDKQLN